MKLIKKHPIAFVQLIGFEITGLSGLMAVVDGYHPDWYYALVGLSFMLGTAILCIGFLIGIISAICKKVKGKTISRNTPEFFIENLAVEYVTKSRFGSIYWITILVLSPITPLLLVHLLDVYFLGALIMAFGLMIWMLLTMRDAFIGHFYRLSSARHYYIDQSGENDELLDSFYGDYVHVYRADLWDIKNEFICNLLKHEKMLGKGIRCYKVSMQYLSEKYGHKNYQHYNDMMLVPFEQFDPKGKKGAKLRYYFDKLSIATFTDFINSSYQGKDSLDAKDYAYTDENISLVPFMTKLQSVRCSNGEMTFNLGCARELDSIWKRYFNCLMVVKLADWDKSENPNLSIESKRLTCSVDMDEKLITLNVFNEPDEDDFSCDSDEEFYEKLQKTYEFKYESISWYWDRFCDYEKTRKLFEKIQVENKKRA